MIVLDNDIIIKVEDSEVKTVLSHKSDAYVARVKYNGPDMESLLNAINKSIRFAKEDMENGWPKEGDLYYTPALSLDELVGAETWRACRHDHILRDRNLVFRTKEDAIAAAKKMLKAIQRDNKKRK